MRTLDASLRWAAVCFLWALILIVSIPTFALIVVSWAAVRVIETLSGAVGEVRP